MAPVFLGIDALGINLPSLIAQLINFGLLFLALSVFAFKPLFKVLDERRRRIQEGLEASEEAKLQLTESEKSSAALLDRARQEGQALIGQAQQMASRIQEEGRQQAHTEADQLLERARNEIQLERDSAISQLRKEFADLTITAAERVIRRSLDAQAHRELIEEVLTEAPREAGSNGGRQRA